MSVNYVAFFNYDQQTLQRKKEKIYTNEDHMQTIYNVMPFTKIEVNADVKLIGNLY